MKPLTKKLKKSKPYKKAFKKGQFTRLWIGYLIQAFVLLILWGWDIIRKPRVIKVSRWTIIITLWAVFMTYKWVSGPPHVVYQRIPKPHQIASESHLEPVLAPLEPKPTHALSDVKFTPGNDYALYNCTWYVANTVKVPAGLGNANTWSYNAARMGFSVTTTPAVGTVAASTAGYYGHVALVVAVGDGQVLLREMNVEGLGIVDERWVPSSDYSYIYF